MNIMPERDLYITEKIKNVAFNIRYNVLAYFEEYQKAELLKKGDQIHLLGKSFAPSEQNLKEVAEEIYKIFVETPWFTYRSGFPELPNELTGSYVSDTGWGCMVRVGQMLFAQIIKEHRQLKKQNLDVLELFNDFDKKAPMSIQNISKLALIYYNLKPGEWYNPSQISNVLASLFEKQCSTYEKLSFLVFNSGNLFFDQILERMYCEKIEKDQNCKCPEGEDSIICSKCFSQEPKFSLSIIVLTRIGIDKPEPKYLGMLERLMTLKAFRGVIGGKPKKALYFLGRHNHEYIYLDPHYVQDASKEIEKISDSYICESFRKCKSSSIDSSLGVCFYIENCEALKQFYSEIQRVKAEDPENMFIFTSDKTPSYIKKEKTEEWELDDSDEDKFEEL